VDFINDDERYRFMTTSNYYPNLQHLKRNILENKAIVTRFPFDNENETKVMKKDANEAT
jgi:hypothetical protein